MLGLSTSTVGYLIFLLALGGTSFAAYLDWKTTEVPDYISVTVAAGSLLLHGVVSYLNADWRFFWLSLAAGVSFFALGWLFYLMGSWGGADAFVLGAVGFAIPYQPPWFSQIAVPQWPYAFSVLLNVFIIGALYTLAYAIYKGFTTKEFMSDFIEDVLDYKSRILGITAIYAAISLFAAFYLSKTLFVHVKAPLYLLMAYIPVLIGFLIMYRYLRVVENVAMRKTISTADLEVGDVLAENLDLENGTIDSSRIVGLDEGQVERIQDAFSEVTIKYGVRFVPVFPVAVILSVVVGDLLVLLISSL
jgi:Flp pilus assembly protein protease CpaA